MSIPKFLKICHALDVAQCVDLKRYMLYHIKASSALYTVFSKIINHRNKLKSSKDIDEFLRLYFSKYSKKTLLNYMSQLHGFTEHWMAHQQLSKNKLEQDLYVQQWLNQHGLYDVANQMVNDHLKILDQVGPLDLYRLKTKSELLFERFFSNNPIKYELNIHQYEEMIHCHLEYSKATELIMVAELINWHQIANRPLSPFCEGLKNTALNESGNKLQDLLAGLVLLVEYNDLASLEKLRNEIVSGNILAKSKLHTIIASYVINKSLNLRMAGKIENLEIVKEIMLYGLNAGIYFSNGKIPLVSFHSLVTKIATFVDLEYMLELVEKNIDNVIAVNKKATTNLAKAQCYFYHKQYEKIPLLLRNWEFEIINQKTIAVGLSLIAAFMNRKKEPEVYRSQLSSALLYFKRNDKKLTRILFDSYLGLIEFMKHYDKENANINLSDYKFLMHRLWCEEVLKLKKGSLQSSLS